MNAYSIQALQEIEGLFGYTIRMPHIGVDCRLAGARHAGIGRYTENLVKRLPTLGPEFDWTFFFSDQKQAQEVLGKQISNQRVSMVIVPTRHYSLAEQIKLPQIFAAQELDLLHVPHFNVPLLYQGKFVITIHDLLWHEYQGTQFTTLPGWIYHLKYLGYRVVVSRAVHQARAIFVPAETIRQTLIKFYPVLKSKVHVTKEGVDEQLKQKAPSENLKKEKILLYVGSLYPHKNVRLIIDALPHLKGYQLWIVGTRNVFQERVQAYVKQKNVEDQVRFLGYVPDRELTKLFERVAALVQPSLSEGFGLTGLEAMAQGLPVLASDIPIFKEIYQEGALYFDPKSPASFASAVEKLEKMDKNEKQKIVDQSTKIAHKYSWDKMAEETLSVYRQVLT